MVRILIVLSMSVLLLPAKAQQRVSIDFFAGVRSISKLKVINDDVFFVLRTADLKGDKYVSDLYQLVSGKSIQLTGTGDIGEYYVTGDTIVLKKNEEEGRKSTVLKVMTRGYGGVTQWLKLPYKIGQIEFVSSGHFFFTASVHLDFGRDTLPDSLKAADPEKRYRVFDELPFWSNGAGDTNGNRTALYEYRNGKITALTDTVSFVQQIKLSKDKRWLAYTYSQKKHVRKSVNRLFIVNTETLQNKELTSSDNIRYGILDFADASHLYVSEAVDNTENPQANAALYLIDTSKETSSLVYDGDRYELGNSLLCDVKSGNRSDTYSDGKDFSYISTDIDYSPLVRIRNGKPVLLTRPEVTVDEFLPYGRGFLLVATIGQGGQEIYFLGKDGKLDKRSDINTDKFADLSLSRPRPVTFTNRRGEQLRGYVLPPTGYEEGKEYPAILDIHGGPKCAYGTGFFHEMQYWTNEGYAVLYINPTGSSGHGSGFAKLQGDFGKTDYEDLMDFVDTVLARVPYIDKDRLGVTGGSYGGIMTNWIIGHTDRFKAAASQRSISNWVSFEALSDIGYSFGTRYSGFDAWTDEHELWRQSPLAYADKVKTPTLFIHSEEDYRCPLPEGLQMYSALQYHKVPSRIVIFNGENHELSRNGKPLNRIKRLYEITKWFDKYLKNE